MDRVSDTPAAPPEGGAIAFENDWEGLRVTLRINSPMRWLVVGFLGFWLCGWAAGEAFALSALLPGMVQALGLPGLPGPSLPSGAPGLGAGGFLLVWLSFWTFGGVAALVTAARMGWGRDVITRRGDEWTVWQGAGPFGRTRRFSASAVQAVEICRKVGSKGSTQNQVEVKVDGKSIPLTTLGSSEEQAWLRNLVALQCRLPTAENPAAAAPTEVTVVEEAPSRPGTLPAGWVAEPLPDGSTRLVRRFNRLAGAAFASVFAAFWNGLTWTGLGRQLSLAGSGAFDLFATFFMVPFVLVGLGLIGVTVWTLLGREEWRVDRNRFLLVRGLLDREWVKHFSGGTLSVESSPNDGSTSWTLILRAEGKTQSLMAVTEAKLGELREMGYLLSYYTRWPLEIPERAEG